MSHLIIKNNCQLYIWLKYIVVWNEFNRHTALFSYSLVTTILPQPYDLKAYILVTHINMLKSEHTSSSFRLNMSMYMQHTCSSLSWTSRYLVATSSIWFARRLYSRVTNRKRFSPLRNFFKHRLYENCSSS